MGRCTATGQSERDLLPAFGAVAHQDVSHQDVSHQ
jgi:hypothetical protein